MVSQPDNKLSFVHHGRKYSLKLRPGKAHFYLRISLKGRRTWRSLESSVPSVAIKNAKFLLEAIACKDWERVESTRQRSPFCSLGEILRRYEKDAERVCRLRPLTVRRNVAALRDMVCVGAGVSVADNLRADCLVGDLVRKYVLAARRMGLLDHSIRSKLACARSVVSRSVCHNLYVDLKLPEFVEFREFDADLQGAKDLGFRPFSADQVDALEGMARRARRVDPGLWLAYTAMARLGLRNSEVWPMRWSWFVARGDGSVVLEIRPRPEEGFDTKSGGARAIGVPAELWAAMLELRGAGVFYLPGEFKTERMLTVYRRLNEAVRPILPGYRAGAYELRRWAGSRVWTADGPAAAQRFLGHSSITTTERYYATYLAPVSALAAPIQAAA